MTSIIGVASSDKTQLADVRLDRMMSDVTFASHGRRFCHSDEQKRMAIATSSHHFNRLHEPLVSVDNRSCEVILFGDIYGVDHDSLCDSIRGELKNNNQIAASFFAKLRGAFIAAVFDFESGELQVVNDRFGQRPLYYAVHQGVLHFSTSLPALIAGQVPAEISAEGLAQFFTFGQYLDCDTLFAGIKVLPAGSMLRFDLNSGSLRIESYLDASSGSLASTPRSDAEWIDAICGAMFRAVRTASDETEGLGVALSGGLDARTLLGLVDHEHVDVKTICLGMPGSLDLRCAKKMSAMVGCQYHAHLLDETFLKDYERHLYDMLDLTGGQYLSQCIVMPTLPVYRDQGIQVLLRGHAGELMHMSKAYAFSIDDEAMTIATREQAKQWLFKHLQAYMLDGIEGNLFQGEYATAMAVAPREAFDRDFSRTPDLEDPRQAIWHAFVNTRLRRETTLSLGKFASVCDVRVPMLDGELVDLLLSAPVELKLGEAIQRAILQRYRPDFLRVINANTGAPMTVGPTLQQILGLKMRVLAKLGAPGYQPYERLGLWLRQQLRDLVRKILLDEQCLDRGVFNPEVLRKVLQNHDNKKANHTYLILAMMVFEAGQRRMADWRKPAESETIGTSTTVC